MARPAGFRPKRHTPREPALSTTSTAWAIHVGGTVTPFASLSAMAAWFALNPMSDDTIVTLIRNSRPIYTGRWGGAL